MVTVTITTSYCTIATCVASVRAMLMISIQVILTGTMFLCFISNAIEKIFPNAATIPGDNCEVFQL